MGRFTAYLGRVGNIVDRVRSMTNDMKTGSSFLEDFEILYWINDCQEDLAGDGFWSDGRKDLTLVAGQEVYELQASTFDPYLQKVHNVEINSTGRHAIPIESWREYMEMRRQCLINPNVSRNSFAVFIEGNARLHVLPVPTEAATLTLAYSYVPPLLGGGVEIALTAEAVVDLGGGSVGLPCSTNDLVYGDRIVVSATTNYNGEYTIDARTTTTQIVIAHAYTAETLTANARCGRYYTPSTPPSKDCMYMNYVIRQYARKDMGPRANMAAWANAEYEKDKRQLLAQAVQIRPKIGPVR